MEPSLKQVLALSNVLKFLPFQLDDPCVRFSCRSWQTFFFGLQCLFVLLYELFILATLLATFLTKGPVKAINFMVWLVAQTFTVAVYFTVAIKRHSLMQTFQHITENWKRFQNNTHLYINMEAKTFLTLWMFLVFLWPEMTVFALHCSQPELEIFISGVVCKQLYSMETCPNYVILLSMLAQFLALAAYFLSGIVADLMPMFSALSLTRSFHSLANHLRDHLDDRCSSFTCVTDVGIGLARSLELQPFTILDGEMRHTAVSRAMMQKCSIKSLLQYHLDVQAYLESHNKAYGPFMIASTVQNFFGTMVLLYSVVRFNGINADLATLVFLINSTQSLIRSTLVLKVFAGTKEAALEAHQVLTLHGGVINGKLAKEEPNLISELLIFSKVVESASVNGGPFFAYTYGFLLSFYSILATYLAILIQSI